MAHYLAAAAAAAAARCWQQMQLEHDYLPTCILPAAMTATYNPVSLPTVIVAYLFTCVIRIWQHVMRLYIKV